MVFVARDGYYVLLYWYTHTEKEREPTTKVRRQDARLFLDSDPTLIM